MKTGKKSTQGQGKQKKADVKMLFPKRHVLYLPLIFISFLGLFISLSYEKKIDYHTADFYAYGIVALLMCLLVWGSYLHKRSLADTYDDIYRDYKRIGGLCLISALCLFGSSYLPGYTEPVAALSVMFSLVMEPFFGILVPAMFCIEYAIIMDITDYHLGYMLIMVIFGVIIGEIFRESKNKILEYLSIFFLMFSLSVLFYYLDNSGAEIENIDTYSLVFPACAAFGFLGLIAVTDFVTTRFLSITEKSRLIKVRDDSFILRRQLKESATMDLKRAVFVSDLSGIIAEKIGENEEVARTAGLYYLVGGLEGDFSVEQGVKIALECDFPKQIIWILNETRGIRRLPSSPISAIVYIADAVTRAFEEHKTGKSKMEYEFIVHGVVNDISTKGYLDKSNLSMNQYIKIRDIMIESSMEYDRRFRK